MQPVLRTSPRDICIGDHVRVIRGIGKRGNWRARGAVHWRVVDVLYDRRFASGIRVDLMPIDPDDDQLRKHPLSVDSGLCVIEQRMRVEAGGCHG